MKLANAFIGIFMLATGTKVSAQTCADFSGDYINAVDTAHPKVQLVQLACESLTLIDNAGLVWNMKLDGTPNALPGNLSAEIRNVISEGTYTVKTGRYPNELNITGHAMLNLEIPITKAKLGVEVEYTSHAYLLNYSFDRNSRLIEVDTDSVKLLSVTDASGAIVGGQLQGFIQGANWIADIAKHSLDTKLMVQK
ncbi:MAG: hypothetical protein ACXVA9_06840 [Bdellovibrionales bacterium]